MKAQSIPETPFERDNNQSASYEQTIEFYKQVSSTTDLVNITEKGMTDAGYPLHLVTVEDTAYMGPKVDLFINNAIHPGEPCGVDASQLFVKDILATTKKQTLLKHCRIYIIPFYNIGGGLNRGSHSRANQHGPVAYGFRGNAKNLDLNRDFIKCDSKNAQTFNQVFTACDPHIMIDNHTSNGADYQYTMTLIASQKDKLGPILGAYMKEQMIPYLYSNMAAKDWEMTPYVYSRGVPDGGIYGFLDYARYSSGYAALHHCISFMPETHMLKPYRDRVFSTQAFLETMLSYIDQNHADIIAKKQEAIEAYKHQENATLDWKLEENVSEVINFKGYKHGYKKSAVTGKDRLYYDRSAPVTIKVNFHNDYSVAAETKMPKGYLIPKGYTKVIDRLKWNGVQLSDLDDPRSKSVIYTYIDDYETSPVPYEGHYLHSKVKTSKKQVNRLLGREYWWVPTDQAKCRYIIETLEPTAPDSYFNWNFMDGILMQKEHFSNYVFEDLAADLLKEDENLRQSFEQKKANDPVFAENAQAQLEYIYKQSPHYEQTFKRYPIFRIEK